METISLLLLSPSEAVYRLSKNIPGYRGFWVALVSIISVSTGIGVYTGGNMNVQQYLTWGVFTRFIAVFAILFFLTITYNYFAEVFGGYGNGSALFKMLPFSLVPYVYVTPAALVLRALRPPAAGFLGVLILIFLIFQTASMQVRMISHLYSIKMKDSVIVFLIPWVIVFITLFTLPFLMMVNIMVHFL